MFPEPEHEKLLKTFDKTIQYLIHELVELGVPPWAIEEQLTLTADDVYKEE